MFYWEIFRATTAMRPFSVEYSQVDSVISSSPYCASTPVSYSAIAFTFAMYASNSASLSAL